MHTVLFAYEVPRPPSSDEIAAIKSTIKKETGKDISVNAEISRIVFGGKDEFIDHIVLDVGESITKKLVGTNAAERKSDLILVGDRTYSVQPCFELSGKFGPSVIKEIDRLYEFVTGIKGIGYFVENRYYIDTQTSIIEHGAMDVAEILVRRMIDGKPIRVLRQGFKALPRVSNKDSDPYVANVTFDGPGLMREL